MTSRINKVIAETMKGLGAAVLGGLVIISWMAVDVDLRFSVLVTLGLLMIVGGICIEEAG